MDKQVKAAIRSMQLIATGIVFAVALSGCAQTSRKDTTIGPAVRNGTRNLLQ